MSAVEIKRPETPKPICRICNRVVEYTLKEEVWKNLGEKQKMEVLAPLELSNKPPDVLAAMFRKIEHGKLWDVKPHDKCDIEIEAQNAISLKKRQDNEYNEMHKERVFSYLTSEVFPRDMLSRTFENSQPEPLNSDVVKMFEAWSMDDDFGFLAMGPAGCGKSHLMHALVNRIAPLYRGESFLNKAIYFSNTAEFLNKLRRDLESGKEFESAKKSNFLFLDDLGVENLTDWSRDELYRLFEYRLNNKLPTFITTNLNLEELKGRLHERLLSRLKDMCVFVQLKGRDRRSDFMKDRMQTLIARSKPETR